MAELVQFLSGNVPGGLLLLGFILLSTNLAMYFLYRASKLFSAIQYRRNIFKVNIPILAIYLLYWIVLSPPSIPDAVLFMPLRFDNKDDILFQSILEENAMVQPHENFRVHRWEYVLRAANPDSVNLMDYRKDLVDRLGVQIVIGGVLHKREAGWAATLNIQNGSDVDSVDLSAEKRLLLAQKIMHLLNERYDLYPAPNVQFQNWDLDLWEKYAKARELFIQKKYAESNALLSDSSYAVQLLRARNHLEAGILAPRPEKKNTLDQKQKNPDFQKVLDILIPYVKAQKDDAQINFILGRFYLFDEKYETAEILLAKSLLQYKYNPELYFNLHYLHWSRILEMGFESRFEVLERAVQLDPGYVSAVHDLADAYFNKGNKSVSGFGTTNAFRVLDDFSHINNNEPSTLSMRARIFLETKQRLKALALYQKLEKMQPDAPNIKYNIGICYFHLEKYTESQTFFEQAIALKDYPDAYLYLGALAQLNKDYDKALEMYRERIKRKSGDDDYYAKQAMRGIRIILSKQANPDSINQVPMVN